MFSVSDASKLANPAPLGLIAFGMTTVLLNIANAFPDNAYGALPMVIAMGIFFGGLAQVIAGILEFKKGNTFGMVAFSSYGFFWLTFATIVLLPFIYPGTPAVTNQALCAYLFMWGLFTFGMFFGTLKANRALQVVFATLFILFWLLALGHGLQTQGGDNVTTGKNIVKIAGCEGILCGFSAVYLAMAEVINEANGTTILPIGPIQPKEEKKEVEKEEEEKEEETKKSDDDKEEEEDK